MKRFVIDKIQPCGTTIDVGDSLTGKTQVMLAKAVHICTGTSFGPYKIKKPGGCIYMGGEGMGMIDARVYAAMRGAGVKGDIPLWINEDVYYLDNPKRVEEFKHYLGRTVKEMREAGIEPSTLFLDTISSHMPGVSEAQADQLGSAISLTGKACAEHGLELNAAHHKNSGGGIRGTTAIRANADSVNDVSYKPRKGAELEDGAVLGVTTLTCDEVLKPKIAKAKDFEPVTYSMERRWAESVQDCLGNTITDADGDVIDTVYVTPVVHGMLPAKSLALLRTLGYDTLGWSEWLKAAKVGDSTASKAIKTNLLDLVEKVSAGWRLTHLGEEALAALIANQEAPVNHFNVAKKASE